MRVIAGEFRSRRLKSLPGLNTRPTPDRLRETLFNVLASRIAGCVFVDVYAGTGAVGIEALSRGARRAIFIEKSRAAVDVIRENLSSLGLPSRAEVLNSQAATVLERTRADIARPQVHRVSTRDRARTDELSRRVRRKFGPG